MINKINKISICLCMGLFSLSASAQNLRESVQHALIFNPDILRSVAENHSAEQGMKQAHGAYLPSLDLALGLGKEKTNTPITQSIGGASTNKTLNRHEASLELKQSLFAGFGIVGEYERKKHLWHAQEYRTLGVASDLALLVAEKYLEVIREQQILQLARINLQDHKKVFDMIQERAETGISRQAELAQAQGRLSLSEANVIAVRNNLRDARINFAALVGESAKNLSWPRVPGRGTLPKNLKNALQIGFDNHPTLKSAYADILEAKAQYKVAKAAYYPKVDLILSASRNRNLDGLVGKNEDNLAMVRLSYNFFRGGSDVARKRETAYQVQEAYEVKNKTINQHNESLRLSWYAWLTAGERLVHLKNHVRHTLVAEKAYAEQFKIAKRTLLDLLNAQNETYTAEIEVENAIIDEMYARYRILNGIGLLLPYLNGKLPAGVHNDDLATSHERIHHSWLEQPVDSVPKVDLSDRSLRALDIDDRVHPSLSKHKLPQTTTMKRRFDVKSWYVSIDNIKSTQKANRLYKKLKRMAMMAFINHNHVYLGPFEYRTAAGKAMDELHDRARVHGTIVHKNFPSKTHKIIKAKHKHHQKIALIAKKQVMATTDKIKAVKMSTSSKGRELTKTLKIVDVSKQTKGAVIKLNNIKAFKSIKIAKVSKVAKSSKLNSLSDVKFKRLGAFAVLSNAKNLVKKLHAKGLMAYTKAIKSSKGQNLTVVYAAKNSISSHSLVKTNITT